MPKVLIIEDDEAMAVALRDGFAYEGYEVGLAQDGIVKELLPPGRKTGADRGEAAVQTGPVALPAEAAIGEAARLDDLRGLIQGALHRGGLLQRWQRSLGIDSQSPHGCLGLRSLEWTDRALHVHLHHRPPDCPGG